MTRSARRRKNAWTSAKVVAESGAKIPQGKYLVDDAGTIAFVIDPGVAGRIPYASEKVEGDHKVPAAAERKGERLGPDRKSYALVAVASGADVPAGTYLADGERLVYRERDVKKFDAPKASLFALIIDGILTLPAALAVRDHETAALFRVAGTQTLGEIAERLRAALPEAEDYLDRIAEEAEAEARANASRPGLLIDLIRHTRALSAA